MTSSFFVRLSHDYREHHRGRRALLDVSARIQSSAKRAIFSLHRQDTKQAKTLLTEVEKDLRQGMMLCKKVKRLENEGAWRAAQEEAVEAYLFLFWIEHGSLSISKLFTHDPDLVLGGLSDVVGEMARYGVLRATEHDAKAVEALYQEAVRVIDFLLQLDLTGYLRTKFDQAKQHLRKLEDLRYDASK